MALSLSINNRNGPGESGRSRNARVHITTTGTANTASVRMCGSPSMPSNPVAGVIAGVAVALIAAGTGTAYRSRICGRKGLM